MGIDGAGTTLVLLHSRPADSRRYESATTRAGVNAFNQGHDLARFSQLPDRRNPWRDPYWFRTGFHLPALPAGRRVWLHFDAINYRADVWLNGRQIGSQVATVTVP